MYIYNRSIVLSITNTRTYYVISGLNDTRFEYQQMNPSKIEKVPSDIRRAQSRKITTSSEKDWSQQVEHMQVQKGRDQVSGGVSVPCRHATPVTSYGDLVYKLRRVKDTPNFISSGSKIVKRLRRRQYDPLIIETTIGLVLGPCTALCRLFLKHCTLTNKAVGTI